MFMHECSRDSKKCLNLCHHTKEPSHQECGCFLADITHRFADLCAFCSSLVSDLPCLLKIAAHTCMYESADTLNSQDPPSG